MCVDSIISKRLKILFGCTILSVVIYLTDWELLLQRMKDINLPVLFLLFTLGFIDRSLMGYKWNFLLRAKGVCVGHLSTIYYYFVGTLLGDWTPGALGADAIRMGYLSEHWKGGHVFSSVVMERVLGLLALAFFVFLGMPFSASLIGLTKSSTYLIVVCGVLFLLFGFYLSLKLNVSWLRNVKYLGFFEKVISSYQEYRSTKRVLLLVLFLSVVEALLTYVHSYVAVLSLNLDVDFLVFVSLMPLLHFLLRIPITIQGIGVQEGILAYVLNMCGQSYTDGLLVSLLLRINGVFAVYIPAMIMMYFSSENKNSKKATG